MTCAAAVQCICQGFRVPQRQVALRMRQFDALLPVQIPHIQHHVAAHIGDAVHRIADPESEFQTDRAVTELDQQAVRRRL